MRRSRRSGASLAPSPKPLADTACGRVCDGCRERRCGGARDWCQLDDGSVHDHGRPSRQLCRGVRPVMRGHTRFGPLDCVVRVGCRTTVSVSAVLKRRVSTERWRSRQPQRDGLRRGDREPAAGVCVRAVHPAKRKRRDSRVRLRPGRIRFPGSRRQPTTSNSGELRGPKATEFVVQWSGDAANQQSAEAVSVGAGATTTANSALVRVGSITAR